MERGHQVLVATVNHDNASQVFEPLGISPLETPARQTPHKPFPLSQNYAQILLRAGFWHPPTLRTRLQDWLRLFEACGAEFILAEHAPGALLAARLAGLRRAAIGTGFTVPPLVTPMPGIQPWLAYPQERLLQIETEFLVHVNPVLADLGGEPLTAVADIFTGTEIFLCTFAGLDHYPGRAKATYYGPIVYSPPQRTPEWPPDNNRKVFLYMRAANRFFKPLIDQLGQMDLSVLACVPDLPAADVNTLQKPNLRVVTDPVDLRQVAADCSLMISQGGTNAGTLMLLAGVPVLFYPLELEQTLWAYRISQAGLGSLVNPFNPTPKYKDKIASVLNDTDIYNQVRQFAHKHAHFDHRQPVRQIVDRITNVPSSVIHK
jgi:UDP:flavonoid glycosyltransferase YjiC (YdhE family)